MKRSRIIWLILYVSTTPLSILFAQNLEFNVNSNPICFNEIYRDELALSLDRRKSILEKRLYSRNNNGNYEVHFHIDTSYERRRVGSYNKNNEVTAYMNSLVTNVITKFNSAAPNWDVGYSLKVSFFDGKTPFSYGSTLLQTLENYTDWLINNNFPGNDDMYVLYSGQYTNSGISYVGTMCIPGVSTLGFISSQNSNEALSSHEWVGHSCNAGHFDSVPNIMKTTNAVFPWNIKSLDLIEDYLQSTSCVTNIQVPLSIDFISWNFNCKNNNISIEWKKESSFEISEILLQKSTDKKFWTDVFHCQGQDSSILLPNEYNKGSWYRLKWYDITGLILFSEPKYIKPCSNYSDLYVHNKILINPLREYIKVYSFNAQEILTTNEEFSDLSYLAEGTLIIVVSQNVGYKLMMK